MSRLQTVKELNVFSLQYSKDFFFEFVVLEQNSYHAPWSKTQFKRRSFHVSKLIPSIKYMKRSTFKSIKFDISCLGQPMNYDRVAYMGISTVERLPFKRRTSHVPNLTHKLLKKIIFSCQDFRPLNIVKMN